MSDEEITLCDDSENETTEEISGGATENTEKDPQRTVVLLPKPRPVSKNKLQPRQTEMPQVCQEPRENRPLETSEASSQITPVENLVIKQELSDDEITSEYVTAFIDCNPIIRIPRSSVLLTRIEPQTETNSSTSSKENARTRKKEKEENIIPQKRARKNKKVFAEENDCPTTVHRTKSQTTNKKVDKDADSNKKTKTRLVNQTKKTREILGGKKTKETRKKKTGETGKKKTEEMSKKKVEETRKKKTEETRKNKSEETRKKKTEDTKKIERPERRARKKTTHEKETESTPSGKTKKQTVKRKEKQAVTFINENIEVTIKDEVDSDEDLHDPFPGYVYEKPIIPPENMSSAEAYDKNLVCVFDFGDKVTEKVKATIVPTKKVIGILGYGHIAHGIIDCLRRTGHRLIVWCRTPEKLKILIKSGVEAAVSPADLVEKSDLIFSCVADVPAAEMVMRADNGVLKGLEHGYSTKGYIEMTTVDVVTSCKFAEEISGKGGLYLEAQLQGTRISAHLGCLVILAAGDKNLIEDCESCFSAMAINVFFLNGRCSTCPPCILMHACTHHGVPDWTRSYSVLSSKVLAQADVGVASKTNIIMNAMQFASFAALADVVTMIQHYKIDMDTFVDILKMGFLKSPQLIARTLGMSQHSKSVLVPARHMEKSMRMALDLANDELQPMPILAAAVQCCKDFSRNQKYDREHAPKYWRKKK